MANTSGGSYRTANEQALVGFFTNVLPKSQQTVTQTSGAIGNIGKTMTTTSTNLSGSNSVLQGGWSGPSAAAFHDGATEIAKFSNTMGTDLGSSGGAGGVAGKLTTVAAAMTTAHNEFSTTTSNWNNFLTTAAQQIIQAVASAISARTAIPLAAPRGGGFEAPFSVTVTLPAPSTAAGTVPTPGSATITIMPLGPSRYGSQAYGHTQTLTVAITMLQANISPQAVAAAVGAAEVDQYLDYMRDSLAKLDKSYSSVATMPTNATGTVYTMGPDTGNNNPSLGGGGLNGGATPNMTTPKTTTPSTSTPQTSAASGAGKTGTGTTGAGTGTTSAGTGTSGAGTGTSLASTPTTTSLGTGTGTGTSTIPTVTSTVPTTSTGTTTGGVVPYVGTALPTTSDTGLGSSKYGLGGSGLGTTGTGVASESTPFSAAAENTGGTGTLGANGLTDGAGAGTAAESGLASEAASTTTGRQMPYMPMMPMSPGMGGDGDRKRSAWLDEDDVWATDGDPVPAVIGGDI